MINFNEFLSLNEDVTDLRDKANKIREATWATKDKIKQLYIRLSDGQKNKAPATKLGIIQLDIKKNELKLKALELDTRSTALKITLANQS